MDYPREKGGVRPRMKQRGVFLIGLILITVYYFLFPRGSGKEIIVSPDSLTILELTDSAVSPSSIPASVVRNGSNTGYLDSDHELLTLFQAERMAADRHWIAVSGDDGLSLMEPDGRLISRIQDSGYPIVRNGQLFLYRNDSGILSKINPQNGRYLWSMEYISAITVLDGIPGKTLVGLLDGRVELIDDSGKVLLKYRPGGSRVEAVYGGALSGDGSKIALISGLDPQRFVLLEERKNGYRPVAHHDTDTDFRRLVSIDFIRHDGQVLYENNGFVNAVNLNGYGIHPLRFSGRLMNVIDNPVNDTLLLFGKDDGKDSIKILTWKDRTLFESSLPSDTAEIVRDRDYTLIVTGNSIAVLEFSVR